MSSRRNKLTWAVILLAVGWLIPLWAQTRLTGGKRPSWIDQPAPGYYIGISHRYEEEADSRADALNNAKRQIIESLGGVIESEFIDRIIETDGKVESVDAFTDSRIKVVSKNIINVKPEKVYTEQWQEGKGHNKKILYQTYVAVYFDENAHRAFMKQLLNETCQLGETQLNSAVALAQQGSVFLAIDQIKAATQHLQPLTEITGIAPTDLATIKLLNEQMLNWVNVLQNGIRIEKQGDKQTTKWGAGLPEPLQVSVFWQESGKRYPISGLPVEFKLLAGKAAFNPYSQTDASGCAFCSVREIRTPGKVEFEALVKFPEGYQITPTSARLTLLPDNKVIMIVNETNLGNPVNMPILGNLLLQTLTESGFHILEANPFSQLTNSQIEQMSPTEIQQAATNSGADLILLASVSSDQPNRVQDGFYFAHARGVLKVYNISQQAFVGNYLVEDKNAGNSPENAGAKAIKKVSDTLIQKFSDEFGL